MMHQFEIRNSLESNQEAVTGSRLDYGMVEPWKDPEKEIHRNLGVQRDVFRVGLLGSRKCP